MVLTLIVLLPLAVVKKRTGFCTEQTLQKPSVCMERFVCHCCSLTEMGCIILFGLKFSLMPVEKVH